MKKLLIASFFPWIFSGLFDKAMAQDDTELKEKKKKETQEIIIRKKGEAEAEIILLKGEAEAKAMNVKAVTYQEWNQAAVVDKLITSMPEIVRAMAGPLSQIDKITIVSTGNGSDTGMNKITSDMTQIAAQVPALFETLSGMKMSDLLGKIKTIGDVSQKGE